MCVVNHGKSISRKMKENGDLVVLNIKHEGYLNSFWFNQKTMFGKNEFYFSI